MTLNEIKDAVLSGQTVHWGNPAYIVVVDIKGNWFIRCSGNDSCIGLTWADGVTLNGNEDEFFIANS